MFVSHQWTGNLSSKWNYKHV